MFHMYDFHVVSAIPRIMVSAGHLKTLIACFVTGSKTMHAKC